MGDRVKIVKLKIAPFLVAVLLAVNPLALCVSAASWSGTGSLGYCWWGANNGVQYMAQQSVTFPYTGALQGKQEVTMNGTRLDLRGGTSFTSPVSIYISGYLRQSKRGPIEEVGDPYNVNMYQVSYKNSAGQTNVVTPEYISIFTPEDEMSNTSDGMTLFVRLDASEAFPISEIFVRPIQECGFIQHRQTGVGDSVAGVLPEWFWTSVRIIGSQNSEELGALDNVADQIIQGNEILEAMKGDIVALLQDIYSVCGDINIAADRATDLLNTIVGYVDGLEGKVDDVNNNLLDTYRLMSGFFTQISKLIKDNHDAMSGQISDFAMMVETRLYEIYAELSGNGTNGEITEGVQNQIQEGNLVQEGLGELDKIDPDSAVDNLYTPNGETEEFASVLSSFFDNSLVMTMLMVSLSMSFVAYVLYGKR